MFKTEPYNGLYTRILDIKVVTDDKHCEGGFHTKTNSSGWTVSATVKCDYYRWIESFEAQHKIYGRVYGDFSKIVYATTKKGYLDFIKNHPPHDLDQDDI
jgi:hypothetical protein